LIEKLEMKKYVIRDYTPGLSQVYLTDMGDKVYENVVIGISRFTNEMKSVLGKKSLKELNQTILNATKKLRDTPSE